MSSRIAERAEIATPIQTIGTIKRVIQGLYSYGRPANRTKLALHMGMNGTETGKTFSDATTLGLVAPGNERGSYVLTDAGRKLAVLLAHGKEEESQGLIAEQILNSPSWSDIVGFLKSVQGPCEIDDLVLFVEQKHRRTWNRNRRIKAEAAYRSILQYANLIRMEDDRLLPTLAIGQPKDASRISRTAGESTMPRTAEAQSVSIGAAETKTDLTEYVQFAVPDAFVVFVTKSSDALEFFRQQLANDSILIPWLDKIQGLAGERPEGLGSKK